MQLKGVHVSSTYRLPTAVKLGLPVLGLWLAACTSTTPTVAPPTGNSPGTAYPGIVESGYPVAPTEVIPPTGGYPAPPTRDPSIIPFELDRPITVNATQVTGSGPAGVPIVLQDVTFMGVVLGETVIGPDNRFSFSVQPLEGNRRIGISIGDLTGTAWDLEVLQGLFYLGPQPVSVPQVGQFVDSELVREAP
jgi:hypothetical protein